MGRLFVVLVIARAGLPAHEAMTKLAVFLVSLILADIDLRAAVLQYVSAQHDIVVDLLVYSRMAAFRADLSRYLLEGIADAIALERHGCGSVFHIRLMAI